MECLGDVSWEYKGAGGVDTAATIGGGVLVAKSTILIIISNIESGPLTIQGPISRGKEILMRKRRMSYSRSLP